MQNPKERVLSLAIAIILVFFFIYGVNVFYSEPNRTDYCNDKTYENIPINQTECELLGGQWNAYRGLAKPAPIENETNGWCNPSYECDQKYDLARLNYSRILFVIMIILGTVCIVAGVLMKTENIGVGVMGGGLITLIYGFIRFWSALPDFGKVILLLAVILAALFWIGVKKLNPKKKK